MFGEEGMISMGNYENLLKKYVVEGKPVKRIVRETGISRNTVRKYVRNPQQPDYKRTKPYGKPTLGKFTGVVDKILTDDRELPEGLRRCVGGGAGDFEIFPLVQRRAASPGAGRLDAGGGVLQPGRRNCRAGLAKSQDE